jgi:hypothetical protein
VHVLNGAIPCNGLGMVMPAQLVGDAPDLVQRALRDGFSVSPPTV